MEDKPQISHQPKHAGSSLALSQPRRGIVARGREDAAELIRRAEVVYRAVVTIRRGEPKKIGNVTFPHAPAYYGVADRNGDYVVDPIFKSIQPFSEGLAAFSASWSGYNHGRRIDVIFNSDLGLWGYLDHNGNTVISPTFERVRGFNEDLAAASIESKWGFIRRDGSWAILPKFDGALSFQGGLARVRIDQKCGFVDKTGAFAIEPRFDLLFDFSNGLASAELNGKVGYIGRDGDYAIEPRFDPDGLDWHETSFQFGVARVELNGWRCLIDTTGKLIFQCESEREFIEDFREGIAIVHQPGGGYFIDSRGRTILRESREGSCELDAGALDAVEGFREGLGVVAASFAVWHHGELLPLYKYARREGSPRLLGYRLAMGKLIVSRLAESMPLFQSAIVDLVHADERMGDPRLAHCAPSWRGVSQEAKERFLAWLAKETLQFFFETLVPRNDENRRRANFWLEYAKQHGKIKDFQVAVSDEDRPKVLASRTKTIPSYSRVTMGKTRSMTV